MVMATAFLFRVQWLLVLAGLLWFIPLFEVDNIFLQIIFVAMFFVHAILGFGVGKKEDDFE